MITLPETSGSSRVEDNNCVRASRIDITSKRIAEIHQGICGDSLTNCTQLATPFRSYTNPSQLRHPHLVTVLTDRVPLQLGIQQATRQGFSVIMSDSLLSKDHRVSAIAYPDEKSSVMGHTDKHEKRGCGS